MCCRSSLTKYNALKQVDYLFLQFYLLQALTGPMLLLTLNCTEIVRLDLRPCFYKNFLIKISLTVNYDRKFLTIAVISVTKVSSYFRQIVQNAYLQKNIKTYKYQNIYGVIKKDYLSWQHNYQEYFLFNFSFISLNIFFAQHE